MSKKKSPTPSPYIQTPPKVSDVYVYFLIGESPTYIYSEAYSEVYNMLQGLFGEDPIPESEALEALTSAGLKDPKNILFWMTRYHYLHKAKLEEVLK